MQPYRLAIPCILTVFLLGQKNFLQGGPKYLNLGFRVKDLALYQVPHTLVTQEDHNFGKASGLHITGLVRSNSALTFW